MLMLMMLMMLMLRWLWAELLSWRCCWGWRSWSWRR
jgi:hypothetical protein